MMYGCASCCTNIYHVVRMYVMVYGYVMLAYLLACLFAYTQSLTYTYAPV